MGGGGGGNQRTVYVYKMAWLYDAVVSREQLTLCKLCVTYILKKKNFSFYLTINSSIFLRALFCRVLSVSG